ncbi:MAG: methenyltetrahydrofolate cyclohydrolase, partial [Chloroflexi bacterium]|nr:methenyltetrahydrofolate cyclohydrolase [Chloroflexota bacterium]
GEVPMRVATMSRDVAILAITIAKVGNVNAVSDAAAAVIMAHAAVQAAALNVKINAVGLQDQMLAAEWKSEVAQLEVETSRLVEEVTAVAAERGGF